MSVSSVVGDADRPTVQQCPVAAVRVAHDVITAVRESLRSEERHGVAASLSQSSLRILDRYLNVLPTFTIREGHRVKVYLSDDLLLPAYEKHQMPSDQ